MHGLRNRYPVTEVTAVVVYPDGERRVELRDTDIRTGGLPRNVWVPVETGPYAGDFDVVFVPDDQELVMAGIDAAHWKMYGDDDVVTSLWISGGALVWTGVWTPIVWHVSGGPARRGRHQTAL